MAPRPTTKRDREQQKTEKQESAAAAGAAQAGAAAAAPVAAAPPPSPGAAGKTAAARRSSMKGLKAPANEQGAAAQMDAATIQQKRKETQTQLQGVERQIYALETQYFDLANPQGNALKGYEGLLSSVAIPAKKSKFTPEDRIFSGSSTSGDLHV